MKIKGSRKFHITEIKKRLIQFSAVYITTILVTLTGIQERTEELKEKYESELIFNDNEDIYFIQYKSNKEIFSKFVRNIARNQYNNYFTGITENNIILIVNDRKSYVYIDDQFIEVKLVEKIYIPEDLRVTTLQYEELENYYNENIQQTIESENQQILERK